MQNQFKQLVSQKATVTENGKIRISPRARNLADRTGVNAAFVEGSGPYGRIIESDVKDFIANGGKTTFVTKEMATKEMPGTGIGGKISINDLSAPAPTPATAPAPKAEPIKTVVETQPAAEYEDVKLPNIRKVIAKSMHASLSNMAQLTLNSSFDATNILAFRKQVKDSKDQLGLENITINDIILYAVSRTILEHKDLNAHYLDDKMRYFKNVNLGVAVDTPRGLMVPTIFNANKLSLNEISIESKKLSASAQSGTINPDLLSGGTFTITNLGTLGIESFTPVINPTSNSYSRC